MGLLGTPGEKHTLIHTFLHLAATSVPNKRFTSLLCPKYGNTYLSLDSPVGLSTFLPDSHTPRCVAGESATKLFLSNSRYESTLVGTRSLGCDLPCQAGCVCHLGLLLLSHALLSLPISFSKEKDRIDGMLRSTSWHHLCLPTLGESACPDKECKYKELEQFTAGSKSLLSTT